MGLLAERFSAPQALSTQPTAPSASKGGRRFGECSSWVQEAIASTLLIPRSLCVDSLAPLDGQGLRPANRTGALEKLREETRVRLDKPF